MIRGEYDNLCEHGKELGEKMEAAGVDVKACECRLFEEFFQTIGMRAVSDDLFLRLMRV